jgi:hypothetical protein
MKKILSVLLVFSIGFAVYYFNKPEKPAVVKFQKSTSSCQLVAPHETPLNLKSALVSKEESSFSADGNMPSQSVKLTNGKILKIAISNCNGFSRELDISPYQATSLDSNVLSDLETLLESDLFNENVKPFALNMKSQLKSLDPKSNLSIFTGKCNPKGYCFIELNKGKLSLVYMMRFHDMELKKIMAINEERQKSKVK